MRLKSVYINEYKNLKDFTLNFDGVSFIDIFVGKNGTGKSNLFEALIEIFRHLYEFGTYRIIFNYSIKYEIDGRETEVIWKEEKLKINGKERKTISKTPLPDNVLIYYSGHNTKVTSLVEEYEELFKKSIKKANIKDSRRFIGIGKEYKQLLLAVLLLQPDENLAKKFICTKLGIKSIDDEIKIILKRPFYARSEGFEIDPFDETTRYWKPKGINNDFLTQLLHVKAGDSKGRIRDEGYFKRHEDFADEYILYYDIKDFQRKFASTSAQDLFRLLDNLKIIEMLNDISIRIKLEDGTEVTTDHFSDGQFQSVYIYSIIELFKDRNCLTLLDEPDSFLHPEWQLEFLKHVFEITDTNANNNHVLMSSHSAVTLVPHNQKRIKLFQFVDNKLCCHVVGKSYAISQLSSNILKYSEDEQILSVIHSINIERKPVFFTEGSTDPIILKEAWQKLFSEPMPFTPIYAFNCVYLRMLLQDNRIFNELGKKPLFGLFDFDEAYNEWNYLKGKRIETDPYKGLLIDIENQNSFAFMLPVPRIPEIESQVIKDQTTKETYCHKSKMTIEHLFFADTNTHRFFNKESIPGGGSILIFKEGQKTYFAENVVPKVDSIHFEVFRPMLEFVKSKC